MKGKKYSFYGLISGLIFLIPIFPIFTLFPMAGLDSVLGDLFNCVIVYRIEYVFFLILAIIVDFIYFRRAVRKNVTEKEGVGYIFSEEEGFGFIFFFNLLLYSLVNSFVFLVVIGAQAACNGDGQTILGVIYSGPISSIVVFINGVIIDIVKYKLKPSETKE